MRKVILRADGNNNIGLGHVYRLLALAEILKNDFNCIFAINEPDDFVVSQITKVCSCLIFLKSKTDYKVPDKLKPGEEILFDLQEHLTGDEIVVTDGYLFGTNYQAAIKATGAKLVCIDDMATTNFYADVVINHAPGVDKKSYKIQTYTKVLTGLEYAIIRPPFFNNLTTESNIENNIFISLGGADYFEYTLKVVGLLLQLDSFKILNVLTTSSFGKPLLKKLEMLSFKFPNIQLSFNLDAVQLVKVLDNCSHALVAASTVLLEAYSRGLKCIAGYYTKNQKLIYEGFITENLAVGVGHFSELSNKNFIKAYAVSNQVQMRKSPLSSQMNIKNIFSAL